MTREEFMATTDIKSPAEAKMYLEKLNSIGVTIALLLIGGIILGVILNSLIDSFYISLIFLLPYFYSIYYYRKLKSKITQLLDKKDLNTATHKTNILSNILFSLGASRIGGLSEDMQYKRITTSLRIIIGTEPPPKDQDITKFKEYYNLSSVVSIKGDKNFWKYLGIAFIIGVIIFGFAIYFIIKSS